MRRGAHTGKQIPVASSKGPIRRRADLRQRPLVLLVSPSACAHLVTIVLQQLADKELVDLVVLCHKHAQRPWGRSRQPRRRLLPASTGAWLAIQGPPLRPRSLMVLMLRRSRHRGFLACAFPEPLRCRWEHCRCLGLVNAAQIPLWPCTLHLPSLQPCPGHRSAPACQLLWAQSGGAQQSLRPACRACRDASLRGLRLRGRAPGQAQHEGGRSALAQVTAEAEAAIHELQKSPAYGQAQPRASPSTFSVQHIPHTGTERQAEKGRERQRKEGG